VWTDDWRTLRNNTVASTIVFVATWNKGLGSVKVGSLSRKDVIRFTLFFVLIYCQLKLSEHNWFNMLDMCTLSLIQMLIYRENRCLSEHPGTLERICFQDFSVLQVRCWNQCQLVNWPRAEASGSSRMSNSNQPILARYHGVDAAEFPMCEGDCRRG